MIVEPAKPNPARLLRAALRLASGGVRVFPCVPNGRRPLTANGYLDASTDPEQIQAWWKTNPTANLGIATGRASFDVLDVNIRGKDSGFRALAKLSDAGLIDGHRIAVTTPSGGVHLYFRGTDQQSDHLAVHYLRFRANGGYVLAPPSVVNGIQYRMTWNNTEHIISALNWQGVRDELQPAPTPPRSAIITRRQPFDLEKLTNWVSALPRGHRHTGLLWAARQAVKHGHTDLAPLIQAAMYSGLPQREALRTVASVLRRATGTAPQPSHRQRPPQPRRNR